MSRPMAPRRAEALRRLPASAWRRRLAAACATTSPYHLGQTAERAQDYDRAVVEYTKAVRANPDDLTAKPALERARLRAAQEHYFRGRRLSAAERHEEALVEFQVASELNPGSADVEAALRDTRQKVRTRLASSREGKTELESLIERTPRASAAWTRPAHGRQASRFARLQQREQPDGLHGARPLREPERRVRSRVP